MNLKAIRKLNEPPVNHADYEREPYGPWKRIPPDPLVRGRLLFDVGCGVLTDGFPARWETVPMARCYFLSGVGECILMLRGPVIHNDAALRRWADAVIAVNIGWTPE